MKRLLMLTSISMALLGLVSFWFQGGSPVNKALINGSFYDLQVEGIDGEMLSMSAFKGKYVMCVNVASNCGYTPQYEGLQKLYEMHGEKLVIIGFPCNQFLGQEPGTEEEIKGFCQKNYGVTFPLTAKIDVKGKEQHAVYQWLCNQPLDGETSHKVKWNFHKFIVSPEGKLIGSFGSKTKPLDEEITSLIKA